MFPLVLLTDLNGSAQRFGAYGVVSNWSTVGGLHSISGRSTAAKLDARAIRIQSLPDTASTEILNKQRLSRPSSPHFTIYQPQLTWLGSIANRVTGAGLSVRTCRGIFPRKRGSDNRDGSALRILPCVSCRAWNIRERQCRRIRRWASRCCQIRR